MSQDLKIRSRTFVVCCLVVLLLVYLVPRLEGITDTDLAASSPLLLFSSTMCRRNKFTKPLSYTPPSVNVRLTIAIPASLYMS